MALYSLAGNARSPLHAEPAHDKYVGQSPRIIESRAYHRDSKVDGSCGKWLAGMDIERYSIHWSGEWLRYGPWLAAPREPRFFSGPRLLFREVPGKNKRIQGTFAKETYYHGHSITPFKLTNDCEVDPLYLVAIVNSTLVSWLAARTLSNFGKDVFPKLNPQDIKALLIPIVKTQSERRVHDELATLAQKMLDLQSDSRKARMALDKTAITRQIDAIDRQIDELVYQLYGLTNDEIAIVEESAQPAAPAAQHA